LAGGAAGPMSGRLRLSRRLSKRVRLSRLWRAGMGAAAAFAAVALDNPPMMGTAVREPPPPFAIEVEMKGAKLRIPSDASREAILAVDASLDWLLGRSNVMSVMETPEDFPEPEPLEKRANGSHLKRNRLAQSRPSTNAADLKAKGTQLTSPA
jgi:hypothetical protein